MTTGNRRRLEISDDQTDDKEAQIDRIITKNGKRQR